jgi:hypothetical protein
MSFLRSARINSSAFAAGIMGTPLYSKRYFAVVVLRAGDPYLARLSGKIA